MNGRELVHFGVVLVVGMAVCCKLTALVAAGAIAAGAASVGRSSGLTVVGGAVHGRGRRVPSVPSPQPREPSAGCFVAESAMSGPDLFASTPHPRSRLSTAG